MATASIPVDLLNPGQVFACIGLAEIALVLHGNARGAFDWSDRRGVRFFLGTSSDEDPIAAALGFLDAAEVVSLAPARSPNRTEKWNVPTRILPLGAPFPNDDESGPPQLPTRLCRGDTYVDISYWGDSMGGIGRDGVKFWGGAAGYPGAAHVRDALASVRGKAILGHADPLNVAALLGANLRLEKRGSCVPLDAGFSPNNHDFEVRTFPLVEICAAIGLTHCRPQRIKKLEYRYGVMSAGDRRADTLLPLPLLRAAVGAMPLPFPQRTFKLSLGWAGQEGQARVITSSVEEFSK